MKSIINSMETDISENFIKEYDKWKNYLLSKIKKVLLSSNDPYCNNLPKFYLKKNSCIFCGKVKNIKKCNKCNNNFCKNHLFIKSKSLIRCERCHENYIKEIIDNIFLSKIERLNDKNNKNKNILINLENKLNIVNSKLFNFNIILNSDKNIEFNDKLNKKNENNLLKYKTKKIITKLKCKHISINELEIKINNIIKIINEKTIILKNFKLGFDLLYYKKYSNLEMKFKVDRIKLKIQNIKKLIK